MTKYEVEEFDPETEDWHTVLETDWPVRVTSYQFAPKTVFETDDPEYNG